MKSLASSLTLATFVGALVAGLVLVSGLPAPERQASLLGALVATLLGLVVMLVKWGLSARMTAGPAGLKALLTAQGIAFFLRLVALVGGALALKFDEALPPMAYVLSFFAVSFGQQLLEVKSLLGFRNPVKSSEVTP